MALEEITLPNGEVVKLGNIIPTKGLSPDWIEFGADPQSPLIPRDQWKGLIDAMGTGPELANMPPLHDQNGVGQCNAEAGATMMEAIRLRQGLPQIRLSGADLYARINGGRDQGSLLEDGMAELLKNGIGTAATSGTLWKTGAFKGEAPAAERASYKLQELYICPQFDHVMSASLHGFFGVSGVVWYDNYTPGDDGWLPRGRGNSGGHAIMSYKPTYRIVGGQIEFGVWHKQSWYAGWFAAMNNSFVISETAFGGPVGGWYCGRSVTDEGGVLPSPSN